MVLGRACSSPFTRLREQLTPCVALVARDVCLVGENPACSVPASYGLQGAMALRLRLCIKTVHPPDRGTHQPKSYLNLANLSPGTVRMRVVAYIGAIAQGGGRGGDTHVFACFIHSTIDHESFSRRSTRGGGGGKIPGPNDFIRSTHRSRKLSHESGLSHSGA